MCAFRRKQTRSVNEMDKEKRVLGLGADVDSRLIADISDLRMGVDSLRGDLGAWPSVLQQRDLYYFLESFLAIHL